MASDLMRIEEVASEYGIAVATLRWWRARGRGEGPKSGRLGRRVVYRRSDVEAWVDAQLDAEQSRDAS